MSFITRLFRSSRPSSAPSVARAPVVTAPSVTSEPPTVTGDTPAGSDQPTSVVKKTKRGARLALFATQGGAFGITGTTPTARRKLLGN